MKIAFYCDTVFTFGGVQRVLAEIAKALTAHHEVTILSIDEAYDLRMYDYDRSEVHFVRLEYPVQHPLAQRLRRAYGLLYKQVLPHVDYTSALYARTFFPAPYKRILTKAILEGGYDVVIGVHAYLSMHLASIRRQVPCPIIGWMHNSYEAFFEKENPYLPQLKDFFRYSMQQIDHFVVLCHTDAKRYREKMGLSPAVIYNPLTVKPLDVDVSQPTVHHRILSVGRFAYRHKGFDILLKAFAPFSKRHPEWTLELVGEGPEQPLYEQIIHEEQMEKQVILTPFTPQIQEHYAAADFYVLSSRWEGFGLVQLEAMAHGLPIVASDLPVTRELFEGHNVGFLFESEHVEALTARLEEMAALAPWTTLKANAVQYARSFTIESIRERWEELIGR